VRRRKQTLLRRVVLENAPAIVLASIVVVIQEMAADIARDLLRDPAFRAHLRAEARLATYAMVRALRAGSLTVRQGQHANDEEA
jgi:hypothetical protein